MSANGENKAGRFGRAFFSAKGRGVWLLAIVLTVAGALPSVVGSVSAQKDGKAIHNLLLESTQPVELEVLWDAPTETPNDYRVSWARVGESFSHLDRKRMECVSNDAFAHDNRPGRRRKLQGEDAPPIQRHRQWATLHLERTGRGGRGGFADSDSDTDSDGD